MLETLENGCSLAQKSRVGKKKAMHRGMITGARGGG
jgi:hypothetical protein